MPASRHQDHTTLPSASAPFVIGVIRVHRISSPTFVTIAKRPFSQAGMAQVMKMIWGKRKRNYFCEQDWTAGIGLIRLEKFGCGRKPIWRPIPRDGRSHDSG
jgi:hypothetical protein